MCLEPGAENWRRFLPPRMTPVDAYAVVPVFASAMAIAATFIVAGVLIREFDDLVPCRHDRTPLIVIFRPGACDARLNFPACAAGTLVASKVIGSCRAQGESHENRC
jgi:hypothetical protein